ncbi:MAG: hypothetical protein HC830_13230 [Bacteroidetes bacterium]|nr:hypothetical protein [Bacteroidota bacterium]
MKIYTLLAFQIFYWLGISAQIPDSSIFDSDFEKKVFYDFNNSRQVRMIDVLNAFNYNPSSGTEANIQTFCKTLDTKSFRKGDKKKQIKTIFKEVHAQYLKKYEKLPGSTRFSLQAIITVYQHRHSMLLFWIILILNIQFRKHRIMFFLLRIQKGQAF